MRLLILPSVAGLMGCLIADTACDRSLEWQRRATHLLEEGRCEEVIETLKGVPGEDSLGWHQLLAFASLDCFRKTGDRAFVEFALDRVAKSLARRPRSASLVHLKGHVLTQTGASEEAKQLFLQAKSQAEANLAAGWSPDGLDADRRVLEDIKKAEARVGSEQPLK